MATVVSLPRVSAPRTYVVPKRALLVTLMVFAFAIGLAVGDPSEGLRRDAELAFLLRGMAALKGLIALGMAGLVWWRLGAATSAWNAAAYLGTVSVAAFATALVWQLSYLGPVSFAFHSALIGLALIAWKDPDAFAS
ncbi:MAG: hypothetical protein AAF654_06605 [Myxococcota bacterium]